MRASSSIVTLVLAGVAVAATAQERPPGARGGVVGQAPARDNAAPASPGTATLRGRVVAGDTGQALRRAQVRIRSNGPFASGQPPENRQATTDSNGRYEFTAVRGGRYLLTVSKPGGYMDMTYGQQRPQEPGKPIDVLEGQTLERIDVSLPRGGVITGRIFDEAGEPVTDVQVAAMRQQSLGGVRRVVAVGRTATTNDIGEFRLFALPAGDYYVTATIRNADSVAETDNRTGYAPTYYPGTADIGAAQRLTLALGQSITDLSIPLIPAQTARVSGLATDSQNRPLRGTVTATVRGGILGSMAGAGPIRPDGSFTINGLPPGDYTLQARSQPNVPPPSPGGPAPQIELEYASLDITVSGVDLPGVRLAAVAPSIISGRIVIAAGDAGSLRISTLRVGAAPLPAGGVFLGQTPPPLAVNSDGTFQARARPAQTRITVQGLTPPWTVKAIRYSGTDVTDGGFEVRPGENLDGLEIELTTRITELSGLVAGSRGEPAKDSWVVLFPRDPAKRRPPTRYVRTVRTDQDGRFKVAGLPPADYLAFATAAIDPNGETTDPEALDRLEARATRVALNEGETKTLDLRLGTLP